MTQSRKASRKAASREKEAGRSWKRRAIFVSAFDPDDERHPGSPESVLSSRRGRWRLSLGRCAAVGLSKAHAHASMTTGARDASSWGSIATARPHGRLWRFLGLGALGRCARLLSQEQGAHPRSSAARQGSRMRASLAARATGNGDTRESVSWLRLVHTCEVRRARRVCPRFVSSCRSRSTKPQPKEATRVSRQRAHGR